VSGERGGGRWVQGRKEKGGEKEEAERRCKEAKVK